MKRHHTGELHKKGYNFAPGAANHTFFCLTLYIVIVIVSQVQQNKTLQKSKYRKK